MKKNIFVLGLFLVGILAMTAVASALTISQVKVDGDSLAAGDNYIEKNDEYQVKVIIQSDVNETYDDAQVSVYLRGDAHDDEVSDTTDAFDIEAGTQYVKTLSLDIPHRMEQDDYKLYVRIEDRAGEISEKLDYDLKVRGLKNDVVIRDVILSPSNGVKSGRALLATVRVQNRGTSTEDDVKVTFSVPELGISASDYIDELEPEETATSGSTKDSKSSEDLYLRIPECAGEGVYEGIVEVEYDDGDEVVKESVDVLVLADETCEIDGSTMTEPKSGKTIISIGPQTQDVAKGSAVVYPVTITNTGSTAKTFAIAVTGGDWGTITVSPSNVVTVRGDDTESMFISVAANANAPAGEKVFGVDIRSGDDSVKQVTLKANITGSAAGFDLKKALEIGLIVLVVILVILGLIIGFSKLKGNDEDKEEGESYY